MLLQSQEHWFQMNSLNPESQSPWLSSRNGLTEKAPQPLPSLLQLEDALLPASAMAGNDEELEVAEIPW